METRTICPYCGVGCGLVLESNGERVVGLRGDAANPVSRGALCPKGATAHEFVHHPDRLVRPLLRREGRDSPLEPSSWDEALDAVAGAFSRIRRAHGPDALAVISSARATVEENYLAQKLARATIGTNNLDNCFRVCHSATVTGLGASFGSGAMTNSIAEFAEPGPRALLVVGSNTSQSHPIIWTEWMKRAVDAGTPLVVVDPRETPVAKLATLHLRARPGSEVALFNAMARHVLDAGLEDRAFVAERCEGFEALREALARWPAEAAEPVCGVPAADIRRAAEIYATAKPASIAYGLGVTEHRNGVDNVRALANLALLTGNVGKPSSGVNALRGQNDVQGATDMCRPESLPGYQKWSDAEAVRKFESAWGVSLPAPSERPEAWLWCSRMWEGALEGQLKGLYCIGSDPALTEGNVSKVERALASLEFLVVQEVFPTRTTALADVVLPACTWAEKDGTFVNSERRVQRVRRAIPPVGDSRPDWRILIDVSERLGYPMPYPSPEDVFEEIRRLVPSFAGITYARIEAEEGIPWPCPDESSRGEAILHVGRFVRGRAAFAAVDWTPPAEETDDEFPLLLTTGRTFLQYNSGSMTRRSRLERGDPEARVEISEADAARLGVRDGERVRVSTRRGALVVRADVSPIREGVVWMPFHFAEAPANALTIDAVDPECGITELKACAARVEAVAADSPGARVRAPAGSAGATGRLPGAASSTGGKS